MSWLQPPNTNEPQKNPQVEIASFVDKYGQEGQLIFQAFHSFDSKDYLKDLKNININKRGDEYLVNAKIFMETLGERKFKELTFDEIFELVQRSFYDERSRIPPEEREYEEFYAFQDRTLAEQIDKLRK